MKIIAINCSPRKNFNTAMALKSALQGAEARGAETRLINIYDHTVQGCTSCLACKTKKRQDIGLCTMQDSLTPLLVEMAEADALIVGTPIYFGDVSASARILIERFAYPFFLYSNVRESKYQGRMKTGFIYTMNLGEKDVVSRNYHHVFDNNQSYFRRLFGHSEYLTICDTLQVEDFSHYVMDKIDTQAKLNSRKEKFPAELKRAFDFGADLAMARN